MPLEFIISYTSMGSIVAPLGIALIHGNRFPKDIQPLLWVLISSMICDLLSFFLAKNSINTHWVGNLYLILQFALMTWTFRSQFQNKKVISIILISFLCFYILNLLFFQGPWVFNSVSNTVGGIILIGFCMVYFYRLLNELPIVHVQRLPMLWIAFAILTYYGGNFFLFLVKNYLTYGETGSHKLMWILHNLLNITKNFLFAVGLWQSYRKVKSSTLSVSAH